MATKQDMTHVKNISLYIPRMAEDSHKDSQFSTLKEFVAYRFRTLAIGIVKDIQLKNGFTNKDGRIYYKAFIHFDEWFDNATTRSLQHRIFNPRDYGNSCAKLVYEDPHFWMLLENKHNDQKQYAFELVSKLEKQLAQVAQLAEMFKLSQINAQYHYSSPPPGNKRSRVSTHGF
uniref:Uncharacterized protein n=1 Tax=viral metagenome TaxID=1070528 RepID=A0A6C0CS93_9ZZZZ